MPVPLNAVDVLQAYASTFRQVYLPGIFDRAVRHGKLARLMPKDPIVMSGPTMEVELKHRKVRATRVTTDPMLPVPDPGNAEYLRYTVRWDHRTPANNDFIVQEFTVRPTYWDLETRSYDSWKGAQDAIASDMEDMMDDMQQTAARYIHLPSDGRLGTTRASTLKRDIFTDATTRLLETELWRDAAVYVAGSTACIMPLATTSMGRFEVGQVIEFHHPTTGALIVDNVLIRYTNPAEYHITIDIAGRTCVNEDGNPVTNLDGLLTDTVTYNIYMHGNYNVAPKGTLSHMFDPTQTYFGLTRNNGAAMSAMPMRVPAANVGATSDITADLLRRAGETAGWSAGDSNASTPLTNSCSRAQYRGIAKFAQDEGIKIVPGSSADVGSGLKRSIGDMGYVYFDPNLGQIAFIVEDFADPGVIDYLDMSTFRVVVPFAGGNTTKMYPGTISDIWNRDGESDGSGRPSKVFSASGYMAYVYINVWPGRNVRIERLTATN